jgi:hypothetical protein
MKTKKAKRLAKKIVSYLFMNGAGEHADRLVLELRGTKKDGGGYSRTAVQGVLVEYLTKKAR